MCYNFGHKIATDYPDIEIVIGAGGLGGDRSGTLRNMLGLPDEFYHKLYRDVMGKVSAYWKRLLIIYMFQ